MLTNEATCSDGDITAKTFKSLGLGVVVGKRTWGGVVGIDDNLECELVDGGEVSYPSGGITFEDGEPEIENYGVTPHIELEISPNDYVAGNDPQLQAAIEHLMAQFEQSI